MCFHGKNRLGPALQLPLQLPGTEAIGGQSWRENPWENIGKTWENNGKKNTLPSGKLSHNYGKSSFFMGKSTMNGHVQ
jgi:hypothetical protein